MSKEFAYGLEMPSRALVGRVSRVEKMGKGHRRRTSYEIDAIDRAVFGKTIQDLARTGDRSPFAVIRIVTTDRRFRDVFKIDPAVGDWLLVSTSSVDEGQMSERRLLAWQAQLGERGYTQQSRGYVIGAEPITRDAEPVPKGVGAQATPNTLSQWVKSLSAFPVTAIVAPSAVAARLGAITGIEKVRVRDVGQASFVTLADGRGRPKVHFDAGWPLSFNGKGAPKGATFIIGKAPVILSHWDWDHLHAYHKLPHLQKRSWITPIQSLGPGAALVANALHTAGRLKGLGASIALPWGDLEVCAGPVGNCNQTGLALRVKLPGGKDVLLVGDADYDHAPTLLGAGPLHGLVVTHHGAAFKGSVPLPVTPGARAIISCGHRNVYRHPRKSAIARHTTIKWRIERTDKAGRLPRGDRWLP